MNKYSTEFVNINMANVSAKNDMVNYEIENKQDKTYVVPRSAADIQRFKLEKLLKKPVSVFRLTVR